MAAPAPIIQKLPLGERDSFVARRYRTPHFEVGWHQHVEYELILFTEGAGMSFVGHHIGEFQTGDIYFLGSHLPHTFQKRHPGLVTSAIVIQFRAEVWGEHFLRLPESRPIRQLLDHSAHGLKVEPAVLQTLQPLIMALEQAEGFQRLLLLGQCLDLLARPQSTHPLSALLPPPMADKRLAVIDQVFQYTLTHYREPVTLEAVARVACLSVSAFCSFFKKSTQKRYIDFLNEVRIGHAAILLAETDQPVVAIGYDCGYQTQANFHKQFFRIKGQTPLQYRKTFDKRTR